MYMNNIAAIPHLVDMHGIMVDDNLDELGWLVDPEVDLCHGAVL
jgi:hypothetical protein